MKEIDKITWREVTDREYERSDFTQARRATIVDYQPVKWELGTFPTELPTKPGAVVAPNAPSIASGCVPYVLGPNKKWYIFDTSFGSDPYVVEEDEIIDYIDDGRFYVAFGGFDE